MSTNFASPKENGPRGLEVSAERPGATRRDLASLFVQCHHLDLFPIVDAGVKNAFVAGRKPSI